MPNVLLEKPEDHIDWRNISIQIDSAITKPNASQISTWWVLLKLLSVRFPGAKTNDYMRESYSKIISVIAKREDLKIIDFMTLKLKEAKKNRTVDFYLIALANMKQPAAYEIYNKYRHLILCSDEQLSIFTHSLKEYPEHFHKHIARDIELLKLAYSFAIYSLSPKHESVEDVCKAFNKDSKLLLRISSLDGFFIADEKDKNVLEMGYIAIPRVDACKGGCRTTYSLSFRQIEKQWFVVGNEKTGHMIYEDSCGGRGPKGVLYRMQQKHSIKKNVEAPDFTP